MFDFDAISSTFARPAIGGIEGAHKANAVQQVAETKSPGDIQRATEAKKAAALPATAAPSGAAKEDAAYWVNYAESRIAEIGEWMDIYNHTKNRPPGYYEEMEDEFGIDFVEQSKFFDSQSMFAAEQTMAAHDMSIRANFDVTGTIYEKNAAGDYQFGKFTIDRAGDGFAIHIDSEDGTRLAFNRGRFTDRFSRAEFLDSDRLPFNNRGARRTDLIA